ncbi:ROK family protein [Halobacillus shinanisalinarum]|uniref:ROK family protein n=1 Tax=Halobacillus shinanisalinarum TaxID=2932258 RepID=A0ABY4H597_9BACI|nr:ROK family protein [Halobacillus shinanisalinarum]UOQ94757.1 ROK family protein [Halobacillus shinanisalinarum]
MLQEILNSTTQKGSNLKALYNYVRKEGPVTKAEIAKQTGLKLSTCARLLDELLENNLLFESGEAESRGGRKPKKYAIHTEVNCIIGIDISRFYSKVLLLTLDSRILEEETFKMDHTSTPDKMIKDFINTIHLMLERQNFHSALLGIGISSIGPLDTKEGMIKTPLHFPAPGWEDVPMVERLKEQFNVEVILDYGENTALIAETRHGAAKHLKNVVHINKGVGIRLGLMVDGHILRSQGGDKVGAFGQGHMVVDIDGRKCDCGSYGCLNAYSTIPALIEEVQRRLKKGHPSILRQKVEDFSDLTFAHIASALEEGDELCEYVIKDTAYYSGAGLSNLINIFHPDKIILNGPMYRQIDLFYKTAIEEAETRYKRLFPDLAVSFSQGELGGDAAAIGAGTLIVDTLLS